MGLNKSNGEIDISTLANQATLEEVQTTIGDTGDTGGSTVAGTVMAKLNENIRLNEVGIQGTNNVESILSGVSTPYGAGVYGDLTFDSSTFTWPSQDYYNRYIVQVKSLTIPEGQTMKPPAKCDGLYILSQGDVTINGNIDVTGLRKTFGNVAISPTINVGNQEFQLAVGGYAPIGGANGKGGEILDNKTPEQIPDPDVPFSTPCESIAPIDSISGNINGGGVGSYRVMNSPARGTADSDSAVDGTAVTKYGENAPTSLIIIAKGNVIINGQILASASDGIVAQNGTDATYVKEGTRGYVYSGLGGAGALPPSGGGAVTIICNEIIIDGKIDTNGKKLVSPDGTKSNVNQYTTGVWAMGAYGGKGGTFISTAGEIKVYTGVNE